MRRSVLATTLVGASLVAASAGALPESCTRDDRVATCAVRDEAELQEALDAGRAEGYRVTNLTCVARTRRGQRPVELRLHRFGEVGEVGEGGEVGELPRYRAVRVRRGAERSLSRKLNAAGAIGFRVEPSLADTYWHQLPALAEFGPEYLVLVLVDEPGSEAAWEYVALAPVARNGRGLEAWQRRLNESERRLAALASAGFRPVTGLEGLFERRLDAPGR